MGTQSYRREPRTSEQDMQVAEDSPYLLGLRTSQERATGQPKTELGQDQRDRYQY